MVEKAPYQVIKTIDDLEIRKYPSLILAVAPNTEYDSGFNLLFNYIQGANQSQKKISMTAPVITSEKIPMTAPVISDQHYMAFVLPSSYSKATVPKPTNTQIKIKTQPERTIAVKRFSGRATTKDIEKQFDILYNTLQKHNIQTQGESFLMRYNSPFAPGFIRRNEVAIEIISKKLKKNDWN
jgi:hypothetical protein